ncbi:deoxyribodipyrimidine photo-lyase type I [Methylophilus rhizosphaerae]|uniref:Deoxyribodipyrimidine photo-lyase n=1 Tax=Methylophilus rhizosphaerae TaxID=492660 RepID=A0A1G8ZX22_9PROT|nr:deoxyribodipyrimidine photo-lyase [Methylophilus rhizosphaerae]SDK19638.1 deoxyribodipyrimidine photo-lyase type I [Methylophilus rhizosphaerae]
MSDALVWLRRDLRDDDHAALYHALKRHTQVYVAFVFDTDILDGLKDKQDRRIEFIWESVRELKQSLQSQGGDLMVLHGQAQQEIPALAQKLNVTAVYVNKDYEPVAIARDEAVGNALVAMGKTLQLFKDQVIFEQDEIVTQTGKPYSVFTPYKNAHLAKLNAFYLEAYPVKKYLRALAKINPEPMLELEMLGFYRTNLHALRLPTGMAGAQKLLTDFLDRIDDYQEARNYPAVKGVSYLSVHLRFGTISIRQLAHAAWQLALAGNAGAATWLSELIWRDFYFQVCYHRPDLQLERQAYRLEYNALPFSNDTGWFEAWCEGRTGFPIVDAAMRQLNQTGYMHNRLRMVVASFLTKDLLIDWRWGEQYFAEKLLDFDFAANNGGWQWAASTGCDAQPYFRIFNPQSQSEKFDPQGKFIRKYVPELAALDAKRIHAPWAVASKRNSVVASPALAYPVPLVEHAIQREQALVLYKNNVKQ